MVLNNKLDNVMKSKKMQTLPFKRKIWKIILLSMISMLVIIIGFCCTNNTNNNTNRIPLFIEKEKIVIIFPVKIESIDVKYMLFDSGFPSNFVMLDSTFCSENPLLILNVDSVGVVSCPPSAWESSNSQVEIRNEIFNNPIRIKLLDNDLDYNQFIERDMSTMHVSFFNGSFGFPNDSTRIWEFNFEHNYLEIHEADNYEIPKDCFKLHLLKGPFNMPTDPPYIQFPISIKCSDGDTITINELYLLDTACLNDIVLLSKTNENVLDFFRKRDDATLISDRENYRSRYNVEATIFDGLKVDSMRIYTNEYSDRMYQAGVIGLNFMKRFNMFFDFKSKQIGFQSINNFKRIVYDDYRRFYFSWEIREDKRRFVKKLSDIKSNYYRDAGLCEGDEVVSINGIELKSLTKEENKSIENSRIREMNILRSGRPLKITVHLGEEAFYE